MKLPKYLTLNKEIGETPLEVLDDFKAQNPPYAPFSSKTVNGTPLFKYALEGRLGEIEIPTKDVEIFSIQHIGTQKMNPQELFFQLSQKIESIKPVTEHTKALGNDFRRPEIRKRYKLLAEQDC